MLVIVIVTVVMMVRDMELVQEMIDGLFHLFALRVVAPDGRRARLCRCPWRGRGRRGRLAGRGGGGGGGGGVLGGDAAAERVFVKQCGHCAPVGDRGEKSDWDGEEGESGGTGVAIYPLVRGHGGESAIGTGWDD